MAAVCALSAACVLGATACNNGGGGSKSGVPDVGASKMNLTEAEWNAAFENQNVVNGDTNYTVSIYEENFAKEENITATMSGIGYCVGNEVYQQTTASYSNGMPSQISYTYLLYEGTTVFIASRSENSENWEVHGSEVGDNSQRYTFSDFTADGDKYTATFTYGNEEEKVTVKISEEGYVKYYCTEFTGAGGTYKSETAVYNFGSTTFTMPAEAKQAVADYKAANSQIAP